MEEQKKNIQILSQKIFDCIKEFNNISSSEIIKRNRKLEISITRSCYCYVLYKQNSCKVTYKEIGDILGFRDHTTIINANKTAKNLIDTKDPMITSLFNAITEKLNLTYWVK